VKRLTLLACILGSGIALVDSTVVNVALPTIQRSLGGGLAAQQWVVNAYLLTLGSLILIGGSLADLFGERRVFALGVAGFGIASVGCALAPTIGLLIACRAVQGVTSALLTPSSLAVIVATFAREERGPAIGTWTAWTGIAMVIGPLVGGELLALGSWRLIFLINVPLVAGCLVLIWVAMPADRRAGHRLGDVDLAGALLCAGGLGGPVFALIEQPRLGWSSPAVLAPLLGGVALLGCFLTREARTRAPMLPLELFRRRNFAAGNLQTLSMYAGLACVSFFLTLFLQQIGGYTPLQSGLATLPITLVMLVLSRRFGALADRFGPRLFMGLGPLVCAAGLLLLMRVQARVDYAAQVLPGLLVFSLGLAMTVAPLTAAVLADVREQQAGIASAVNNAIARVAALLATAAVGAAVAGAFATALDARLGTQPSLAAQPLARSARIAIAQAKRLPLGRPQTEGLPAAQARALRRAATGASVHGFRIALEIGAGLLAVGGATGLAGIRNPRRLVRAAECEGGQLVGVALDAADCSQPTPAGAQPAPSA
jgi:EmrB/QacA subfamily drug resistance transporter